MHTLSEKSFASMCRTCMNEVETSSYFGHTEPQSRWQSIFDKIDDCGALSIADLISKAVPQIEVQLNDEFPKKICCKCLHRLVSAYRFQQMCVKSDKKISVLVSKMRTDLKMSTMEGEISISHLDSILSEDFLPTSTLHNFREVLIPLQHHSIPEPVRETIEQVFKPDAAQSSEADPLQNQLLENCKVPQIDCFEFVKNEPIYDGEPSIQYSDTDTVPSSEAVKNNVLVVESEDEQISLGSSQHICHLCNKSFKERCYLKNHLKRHNTGGEQIKMEVQRNQKFDYYLFKCDICNRRFHKAESLYNHRLVHDDMVDSKMYWHACDFCGKAYSTRHTLARHLRKRHPTEKSQQKDKKDTEKQSLTCDLCGKMYSKQHNLTNHKRLQHSTDKPKPTLNSCNFCDKSFSDSSALRKHVRTHTRERPYLCPECGKSFGAEGNLKQHLLRHSGDKPYECPYCPQKFSCHQNVSKHKIIHEGIKRHVCDICGNSFGKSDQLKRHKLVHSAEKPHNCDFCEKRFNRIEHLRRHMRTHTGEKPYKCKYCDRAYAQSNDHIKHLRTHVGDKVYRCELCPLTFRLASELRSHFTTHKNEDPTTRDRNMKALKEEQAKLQLKLAGKDILTADVDKFLQ